MTQNIATHHFKDFQAEHYETAMQYIQMRQLSIFEHINDTQIQIF